MATWSDVGVAAVGGASGIMGALVGAVAQARLTARGRREERADTERRQRLERVAEALGPIQTLLIDLLPPRALNSLTSAAMVGADRTGRWLPLREKWEVVLVKEPDADIRESMRELEVEIENLYTRLALALQQTTVGVTSEDGRTWYDEAVDQHTEATRLAEAIADDLHRGNNGATRGAETDREATTPNGAESAE